MATEQECSIFWLNKSKENIFKGFPDAKTKQAELEYNQQCGMYDTKVLDCIRINADIQNSTSILGNQALMYFDSEKTFSKEVLDKEKKLFADKGCAKIIEQYRQAELGKVIDKFSGLDKARIEAESIYERNQRIFFGGLVLIGGIIIITMFGKKK
jgi:hypothetical protein